MKKITIITILLSSYLFANINCVVSILPQKTFLKAIGGDKVNITLMVKPGNSPHTYEPKPSQMMAISKADVYFSIGVEFEKAWLDRFKNQNQNMIIVDTTKNIEKIDIQKHSHGDEHRHEKHENKDPHIWTSPRNVKIIAQNIFNQLSKLDKTNRSYYKKNLDKFLLHVEKTDKKIRAIIKQNSRFMVFHPSWEYFAKEYNLIQIPIEIEGKSPKPRELKHIIEEAKKEKISVIFTSPEFSDNIAKQIAKELKISVVKISPMNKNWGQNLINLSKSISKKHYY